ncbi:MAG TPA: hypothetical protein VHU87_11485 [Rhizomicrobium sp.]|jgi:hypothetical protein|nr:hypothetical protein [Rhizomicrobium sp.]
MKSILFAVAAACVLSAPAQAAPAEPALAPFSQFVNAMNAGDTAKAAATYAPTVTIIDEFGPHIWNSFAAWDGDLGTSFKTNAVSDFHIAAAAVSFKAVSATAGYGVVPTTLTYKVKGKPVSEKGLFTFSTAKGASGWRITGWAWSTL